MAQVEMSVENREDIPLPDELDGEEEAPFRRRQRAVRMRGGRLSRLRRVACWGIVSALILLPAGYGAYRLVFFALTSPRFMLASAEDVMISGNQYVSREEILNAFGIPERGKLRSGVNIFRLSLEEKRKQVESIPWVQSATLSRAYPHRLSVTVLERTPLAFVNVGGRVKLVDGEGVLLEEPGKGAFNFPVLTGLGETLGPAERRARVVLYQQFWRELDAEFPGSGWMVSEVDLSDPEDLKAILVRGREALQVHFGNRDFAERFEHFLALLPELRRSHSRIDSVDLRYRNQIIVSPESTGAQEAPAPEPSTGREE